ncbi:hypothetical protein KGF54_004447 [Candida jiufengensis]|uniref:uncharacterized protein n=1 Tax=Candida jiufengensis TaxID=497108 RepID=UPI00222451D5|nr:uncharacterized protein KGF54_004447 [Candida jiufengensis]KAI5951373.1 hypothetical protein KGF54_004447 [Candida jiufengensis]
MMDSSKEKMTSTLLPSLHINLLQPPILNHESKSPTRSPIRSPSKYNISLPAHEPISESLSNLSCKRPRSASPTKSSSIPSLNQSQRQSILSSPTKKRPQKLTKHQPIIVTDSGEKYFRANYRGPVTIQYLKFLCKVATYQSGETNQHKKRKLEPIKVQNDEPISSQDNDEVNSHETESVNVLYNDLNNQTDNEDPNINQTPQTTAQVDDSEPIITSQQVIIESQTLRQNHSSQNEPVSPFLYNASEHQTSKPVSYLQKILSAQRAKSSTSNSAGSDLVEEITTTNNQIPEPTSQQNLPNNEILKSSQTEYSELFSQNSFSYYSGNSSQNSAKQRFFKRPTFVIEEDEPVEKVAKKSDVPEENNNQEAQDLVQVNDKSDKNLIDTIDIPDKIRDDNNAHNSSPIIDTSLIKEVENLQGNDQIENDKRALDQTNADDEIEKSLPLVPITSANENNKTLSPENEESDSRSLFVSDPLFVSDVDDEAEEAIDRELSKPIDVGENLEDKDNFTIELNDQDQEQYQEDVAENDGEVEKDGEVADIISTKDALTRDFTLTKDKKILDDDQITEPALAEPQDVNVIANTDANVIEADLEKIPTKSMDEDNQESGMEINGISESPEDIGQELDEVSSSRSDMSTIGSTEDDEAGPSTKLVEENEIDPKSADLEEEPVELNGFGDDKLFVEDEDEDVSMASPNNFQLDINKAEVVVLDTAPEKSEIKDVQDQVIETGEDFIEESEEKSLRDNENLQLDVIVVKSRSSNEENGGKGDNSELIEEITKFEQSEKVKVPINEQSQKVIENLESSEEVQVEDKEGLFVNEKPQEDVQAPQLAEETNRSIKQATQENIEVVEDQRQHEERLTKEGEKSSETQQDVDHLMKPLSIKETDQLVAFEESGIMKNKETIEVEDPLQNIPILRLVEFDDQTNEMIRIIESNDDDEFNEGSDTEYTIKIDDINEIVQNVIDQNKSNEEASEQNEDILELSKAVLRKIQSKSNSFLQNLMNDLKMYAFSRDSTEVDMSDVLLYLKRINFAGNNDSTKDVEKISGIAQRNLPLELFMQLDDSLCQTISLLGEDDSTTNGTEKKGDNANIDI